MLFQNPIDVGVVVAKFDQVGLVHVLLIPILQLQRHLVDIGIIRTHLGLFNPVASRDQFEVSWIFWWSIDK